MYLLASLLVLGFIGLYLAYIRNSHFEDKNLIMREELAKKKYADPYLAPSSSVYIAKSHISAAGRGVFAGENIKKGETIEMCPVVSFLPDEQSLLHMTKLRNHFFSWGNNEVVLCLGFGSLYNHSIIPNATYVQIHDKNILQFLALRDIQKGEEITHNYGWDPIERTRNEIPDF